MDLTAIPAKVQDRMRTALLISLGAAACISLPLFLATATFVLLFVVLPLSLLSAPVQVAHLVFDAFSARKDLSPPMEQPLPRLSSRSGSRRRHGPRSTTSTRSSRRGGSEDPVATRNASQLPSIIETPRSILGILLTDSGAESAASPIPSRAPTPPPTAFVESPVDIRHGSSSPRVSSFANGTQTNALEQLSGELLEEVARHLPERSLSTLALVSKRFGSQFRFRRLHSGTEDCALPTFSIVKKEPRLGQYTTRLVVHKTFFRPSAKVQWLLEGSEAAVSTMSWNSTELKKQSLLEAVLRACPRIRSLVWNEGRLPLSSGILNALGALCSGSLRHLDVPIGCSMIEHLNESSAPGSLRLNSLTLRGGFSVGSSSAVIGIFLLSKTIQHVRFQDTDFGISHEATQIILSVFLQECSPVQRVDFIEPRGIEGNDIPIIHSRKLLMKHVMCDPPNPIAQFQFQIPTGTVLHNMNALVFVTHSLSTVNHWAGAQPQEIEEGLQSLCKIISTSPNLRVFCWNVADSTPGWGWAGTSCPPMPENMINAIISKQNLVSLSLLAFILNRQQLQDLCGSLSKLQHLAVLMEGEAVEISTYSQNFSKLLHLIALEVVIMPRSRTTTCACGHERDPRIPHQDEGTAMGRLCRRIRPPMTLAIVRLSQDDWPPVGLTSELRWIGPLDVAMKRLEAVCGPCETDTDAVCKVFNPRTWLDIV